MLERRQPSLIKKPLPGMLDSMGMGRGSLAMDGITPSFQLNFADSGSIKTQAATATFTRATTATVVDHDSVVRSVLSSEARFQGLRRVQNRLVKSEDLANSTYYTLTGATCVSNAAGSYTLTVTQANFGARIMTAAANEVAAPGTTAIYSVWLAANTVTAATLLLFDATASATVTSTANQILTIPTSGQRYALAATGLTVGHVYRLYLYVGGNQGSNSQVGDSIFVKQFQLEYVDGQAVQNPSEYVSVGVLSAPYHGANVDGVKYFPTHNGNVVQQNICLRSQDFGTTWTNSTGSDPLTLNVAIAPDGTLTADQFAEGIATGFHNLRQQFVKSTELLTYTFSIYAKLAAGNPFAFMQLDDATGSNGVIAAFNLQTGVLNNASAFGSAPFTLVSTQIQALPNGWYRLSLTGLSNSVANVRVLVCTNNNNNRAGDGVSSIYWWGAQLQPGRRASTYVATTTVAVNNNIVEEQTGDFISPTTRLGYLAEGSRTNLILQSQTFNTTWTATQGTLTADQTTAPDGTTTADKFIENTVATTSHDMNQGVTKAASALAYTLSCWFKVAAGGRNAWIQMSDGVGNGAAMVVSLSTGAVLSAAGAFGASPFTSVSGTVTAYPNSWYYITLSATSNTATSVFAILGTASGSSTSYTGDGTSGIYLWGAQLEQASFASSYIPTTTVSVTRNADVLTYPIAISDSAGTALAKFTSTWSDTGGASNFLLAKDVNGRFFYRNGSSLAVSFFDGTNIIGSNAVTSYQNRSITAASAWSGSTVSVSADSTAVVSGTYDGSLGTGDLAIGCSNTGGNQWFGTIARVAYYPQRLSNAVVQQLSR